MKTGILLLILFLVNFYSNAQVTVVASESVDLLLIKAADCNAKLTTISGYRIQVFSSSERSKASEVKSKLLSLYPDAEVTFMYQAPHFKVRVGNYRNRIDCQHMFRELLEEFPQSFIVPDKVDVPAY